MSPASEIALTTLRQMARGHVGAASGEAAAWRILQNLRAGTPVDFGACFVSLDGQGRLAVLQLLLDLSSGKTGLVELR